MLRDLLLAEHSKAQTQRIVSYIGTSTRRFNQLYQFFLSGDDLLQQRAAWPLSYIAIAQPAMIKPHFESLMKQLTGPDLHPAVRRNTMRLLEEVELPPAYHGKLMHDCFEFLLSSQEKPAVKASAITILHKLSKAYPEIIPELRTIIETRWECEGAAFRARARKII